MHRAMYGRLSALASNSGVDVWLLDGHALGAIAVVEDIKGAMVIFSSTLPSEFMQTQRVFSMQETIKSWPVILNTASEFDPAKGLVHAMHGDYPDTFRFVGSVYNRQKIDQELGDKLQQWLDDAQAAGEKVVYISLGTVKKIDI